MRIFEILSILLLAGGFGWVILPRRRPLIRYFIFGAALTLLLHLFIEGYRWQMVPAYLIAALFLWLAIGNKEGSAPAGSLKSKVRLLFSLIAFAVGYILAILLPSLFPVPKLPEPAGEHPIGTTIIHLIDDDRNELYSENPADKRELMLQIWYPADLVDGFERAPYMDRIEDAAPVLADQFDLPAFFFGHIRLAKTAAFLNAPVLSGERLPILLFSHGLTGFRSQNTFQMEFLASQGYIVASVDHAYDAAFTVLPEDRVVLYARDKVFPSGSSNPIEGNGLIDVRRNDLAFMLDTLAAYDDGNGADGLFTNRLNFDQVGVFGHSTGGGAAVELCGTDSRCSALLALDGWLLPVTKEVATQPLSVPFMSISTPIWLGDENRAVGQQMHADTNHESYLVYLADTGHFNFTDLPLFSPLTSALGLSGDIDGPYGLDIVNAYTLAFFDQHLRGIDSELLRADEDRYPEVETDFR